MSQKNISFVINYEGTPEKATSVTLYAFDPKGELIATAELKRNQAQLSLTDAQAKTARIVLAPSSPLGKLEEKLNFDKIQTRQAYLPKWAFDPKITKYELQPIPKDLWKLWMWCKCEVKGQVIKPVKMGESTQNWPIYQARVHICEVDPIWIILRRIPVNILLKARDEIIKAIGKPIPTPPEPDFQLSTGIINPTPENIARAKMAPDISLKTIALKTVRQPLRTLAASPKLVLSAETKTALSSTSPETVKQALLSNSQMIYPFLCHWPWIWPYFVHCDEVAVVLTDKL